MIPIPALNLLWKETESSTDHISDHNKAVNEWIFDILD